MAPVTGMPESPVPYVASLPEVGYTGVLVIRGFFVDKSLDAAGKGKVIVLVTVVRSTMLIVVAVSEAASGGKKSSRMASIVSDVRTRVGGERVVDEKDFILGSCECP